MDKEMEMEINSQLIKQIKSNDYLLLKETIQANPIVTQKLSSTVFSVPNTSEILDDFILSTVVPSNNLSLLHICAIFNSLECFLYLYYEFIPNLRIESADSYYPLHYACLYHSTEVAFFILDYDPEQGALTPHGLGHHFLHFAAFSDDIETLEYLFMCGADLRAKANVIDDPISKAIACGNLNSLKILLNHGTPASSSPGLTLAMKAVMNGRDDAVLLFVHGPDDLKKRCPDGKNLVQMCCFSGKKFSDTIIKLAEIAGCESIEMPPGQSSGGICHWICQLGDLKVAKALVKTEGFQPNLLDGLGNPGPFKLIDKPDHAYEETPAILELLIANGLDVNARKLNPSTQMYDIPSILEKFVNSMCPSIEAIECLIKHGADIYAPTAKSTKSLYNQIIMKGGPIAEIFKKRDKENKLKKE